jgi:molybdate transport system regulatory protein
MRRCARRYPWLAMAKADPKVQFRLRIVLGDDIAVGPGKVDLLEAIGGAGSITAAARTLGMSYRRAWLLVDTMNRCFDAPVVTAEAGGASGGGARLTPTGAEVVRRYRHMESTLATAGADDLAALVSLLRKPSAGRVRRGTAGT